MAKKNAPKPARNSQIKQAIKEGEDTRSVGKRFGISNKRAWDIANRKGNGKKKK